MADPISVASSWIAVVGATRPTILIDYTIFFEAPVFVPAISYCWFSDVSPILIQPVKKFDWDCYKCGDALVEALDKMIEANACPDKQVHGRKMTRSDVQQRTLAPAGETHPAYPEVSHPQSKTGDEDGIEPQYIEDGDGDDTWTQQSDGDYAVGNQINHVEDTDPNCIVGTHFPEEEEATNQNSDSACYNCEANNPNKDLKGHIAFEDTRDMSQDTQPRQWIYDLEDNNQSDTTTMVEAAMIATSVLYQLIQTLRGQHNGDWPSQHNVYKDWAYPNGRASSYAPPVIRSEAATVMCF